MKTFPVLSLFIAFSLMASTPALADRQICEDSLLCAVGLLPIAVVAITADAVISALTPEPPIAKANFAIQKGDLKLLQSVLIWHPNLQKTEHLRLLTLAIKGGQVPIITHLLENEATTVADRISVLPYAKTAEVIELLNSGSTAAVEMDLFSMSETLQSPKAAELIATVLNHRDALTPNDPSALKLMAFAVRETNADVVSLLLERGINPDGEPPTYYGYPALIELSQVTCSMKDSNCTRNAQRIGRDLIAKGADVNLLSTRCYTPLSFAVNRTNTPIVELLQEAGAVTRTQDEIEIRCRLFRKSVLP